MLLLVDEHLDNLRRCSALGDAMISEMSCCSVLGSECAEVAPFLSQCRSLLAIPYLNNSGFTRYKLFPALGDMRYYQAPGSGNHLYILPSIDEKLHDTATPLLIVEGEKKCACLVE